MVEHVLWSSHEVSDKRATAYWPNVSVRNANALLSRGTPVDNVSSHELPETKHIPWEEQRCCHANIATMPQDVASQLHPAVDWCHGHSPPAVTTAHTTSSIGNHENRHGVFPLPRVMHDSKFHPGLSFDRCFPATDAAGGREVGQATAQKNGSSTGRSSGDSRYIRPYTMAISDVLRRH
jgi:hypothetical protein